MMRRGLKKQRQISVFYMNFSYICFNRIAPATAHRTAGRRPHSIVSEYIVYI